MQVQEMNREKDNSLRQSDWCYCFLVKRDFTEYFIWYINMASECKKNRTERKVIQTGSKGYYEEVICELLETLLILLLSSV